MNSEPLRYGIRQSVWDKILRVLKANKDIVEILLFGSRAKGNFKPGSDIDICLKCSELPPGQMVKIASQLDELDLPWLIDLIHYESISNTGIKEHIDRVGIKLS